MTALRIGIVTCSDTRNAAQDTAGAALRELVEGLGWEVAAYRLCPDERDCIEAALVTMADVERCDVVFTTGGTGLSPRDITPEATLAVCDRTVPGIAEAIRAESLTITKRAMLSRGASAMRGTTLVINLPGSEKAVGESFAAVAGQLEHAVEMMAGGGH